MSASETVNTACGQVGKLTMSAQHLAQVLFSTNHRIADWLGVGRDFLRPSGPTPVQ